MQRMKLALAAAVAAGLLAGCSSPREKAARAGPPAQTGVQVLKPAAFVFMGYDANGDYAISREEFNAGVRHTFTIVDSDGSGVIELIEYQDWSDVALGSRYASPTWERVNRDGSGGIDEYEFIAEFTHIATEYGLESVNGLQLANLTGELRDAMATLRPGSMSGRAGRRPGGRGGGQRGESGPFPLDVAKVE